MPKSALSRLVCPHDSKPLERCPNHPHGGCSLARHGTYARKTPRGTLTVLGLSGNVQRWGFGNADACQSGNCQSVMARLPVSRQCLGAGEVFGAEKVCDYVAELPPILTQFGRIVGFHPLFA